MARPPLKDINSKSGLVGLGPIPSQSPVASFNIDAIENLLQTKSFDAYHYAHAYLPNRESIGAPANPNTQGAQRGVFYYSVRKIGIVPQQFKLEDRLTVQGLWGIGSAMFNVTGHYLDGNQEQAHIKNRDLIVLPDITFPIPELVEYNPTGPLNLHFQARGVDYLSDGTNLYNEGVDFYIQDGDIHWTADGKRPSFKNGKGDVLTVVYFYNPIFIVQQLPHSLRIIPSNNMGHGGLPRNQVYAPQLLVVKPSTIAEEKDIMNWRELPQYPSYRDTKNTTGGSI